MLQKNIYKNFDDCYKDVVNYICKNGTWITENVRTKYIDGTPATYKSVIGLQLEFEPTYKDEMPAALLPTTRKATPKSSIRELFWIWILRSNKVEDLRKLGCKYWNEFELEDGSIGRSYAYQMNKPMCGYPSQTDYVIGELKNNPNSRRTLTELWHVEDTPYMSLTPCVHLTQWSVIDGKLILSVRQRSADIALGTTANWFQYQVLHHLIAKECELEVGNMIWTIDNAHIYDRHIDDLQKQVNRPTLEPPTIYIPKFKSIYDLKPDMIEVRNYKSHEPIKYEVAI
ncbi:thymidylate synthase [Fusobacterium necrophorum subsp. funduliforme]|uniref:thymidylate synthase n=1 Tax=Fusobacterium necrophorum TaxID=859 RepID=UPI00370E5746